MMMAAISSLSVAAVVYFICGFAWQGFIGRPGHVLALSGKSWNWIAAEPFFSAEWPSMALRHLCRVVANFLRGLAALIRWGAARIAGGFGELRFRAILAGWTYPLFAHWVWEAAGSRNSAPITDSVTGSLILGIEHDSCSRRPLSSRCYLDFGPRRGKYSPDAWRPPSPDIMEFSSYSAACWPCWMVWTEFRRAILFTGSAPAQTILIAINTMLQAAAVP